MYSKPKLDEMKIYSLNFQTISNEIFSLRDNLTSQEIVIANKYKFEKDRSRFVVARSCLRKILSDFLSINAKDITISSNQFGKPILFSTSLENIKFNLSHSGDTIVYAFSLFDEVGIDIEILDTSINHLEIAENYFTSSEIEYLKDSKSMEDTVQRFFRIWTRKEALLKSIGTGLLLDMKKVDVLSDTAELNLFSDASINYLNKTWNVTDLFVNNNYKAAYAYSGNQKRLTFEQI